MLLSSVCLSSKYFHDLSTGMRRTRAELEVPTFPAVMGACERLSSRIIAVGLEQRLPVSSAANAQHLIATNVTCNAPHDFTLVCYAACVTYTCPVPWTKLNTFFADTLWVVVKSRNNTGQEVLS